MLHYVRAAEQDEAKIRQFLGQFPVSPWSQNLSSYLIAPLGGVFLATDDDSTILGCTILAAEHSRERYLLGTRIADPTTNPDIAHGLCQHVLEFAGQTGARTMKALIEDGDEDGARVLRDAFEFTQATSWAVGALGDLPLPQAMNPEAGPAWAVDRERLFAFLADHAKQLWAPGDPWLPRIVTEEDLAKGFEVGGVVVAPQDTERPISALALYRIKNRERLTLGYLNASDPASVDALLSYLLVEAHAWGVTELRYGLSSDQAKTLLAWFDRPGEPEWSGWLLEKVLHPAAVPS